MKTKITTKLALVWIVVALAASLAAPLRGGEDKPAKGPPLKLKIDTKPVDRDAPDRVSYAPIVKKTAASVVHVYSSKKVRGQDISPLLNDPTFRRFFEVPPGRKGRTPDQTERGLGSGVVITSDGYILTNNHVVEGADEVKVALGEATKRYTAKIVGRDSLADVAVLKIEATGLSPATFGDSDQLQVGDLVLAIGNPFGIGQSVSRGIVSALGRGQLGIEKLEDFIQVDAAINPGNSGGALIDSLGRVVGINTAILSSSGGFNGVGLAIPINLVRYVAEQIVNTGRVERGYLGVATQDLSEDLTTQFGTDHGALVSEVKPDSPAEKGGIIAGDVITKLNGAEIRDSRQLTLAVTQLIPTSQVSVEYIREGKTKTASIKLGLRPGETLAGDEGEKEKDEGVLNGVGVGDITPQLREQLDLPARIKGAIITEVKPDSPSARQGLKEGDVILDLDFKPVKDANEAVKRSEEIKGPKVTVRIWRNGRISFLVIDESK